MKSGTALILSGIVMLVIGLGFFYSIQNNPDLDELLRYLKHGGTFVGLMGIGVIMAGILLYLMGKEETPIEENYDV
jgi:hypothetical protein